MHETRSLTCILNEQQITLSTAMEVIGCGCRCSRKPKFSLKSYMSTNQVFFSFKIDSKKTLEN